MSYTHVESEHFDVILRARVGSSLELERWEPRACAYAVKDFFFFVCLFMVKRQESG